MLNEIGNKAFFKCSSLTSICYHGSKTEWDTISKDASCPASAVIHYKADTEEAKDPTCTEPGRKVLTFAMFVVRAIPIKMIRKVLFLH